MGHTREGDKEITRKGELSTASGLWITRWGQPVDNIRRACLLAPSSLARPQLLVDNPVDI